MLCCHKNTFLVVQGAHGFSSRSARSSCDAPRPRASSEPPVKGAAETLHDIYAASLALRAEDTNFRRSLGSVGHPEFCRKACIHHKFQGCSHGASCQFCHEPHCNDVKFQKRQRDSLREMSEQNLLHFLFLGVETGFRSWEILATRNMRKQGRFGHFWNTIWLVRLYIIFIYIYIYLYTHTYLTTKLLIVQSKMILGLRFSLQIPWHFFLGNYCMICMIWIYQWSNGQIFRDVPRVFIHQ